MKRFIISSLLILSSLAHFAVAQPRLVVNIVVSQMRTDELERFAHNFTGGGFAQLLGGVRCDYGHYCFMPSTPSSLATLTTGANPSLHGIIGESWWDYNSGRRMASVEDSSVSSYECNPESYQVSARNIIVPTLGDRLMQSSPESKVVSVAADAVSAIVMGGKNATQVWWIDSLRAKWTTSTAYAAELPAWVRNYNAEGYARSSVSKNWVLSRKDDRYLCQKQQVVCPLGTPQPDNHTHKPRPKEIPLLRYTPVYNDLVAEFVKEAVIYNSLGDDQHTDLLNICFDAPRWIAERYGTDSRETEDMYYRLDATLAELINFISAQCDGKVVYVLTSDHGALDNGAADGEQTFNTSQFRYLAGSFMSATYGNENWVLGYDDRQLWLNRTLIFNRGLNLSDIQKQLASFALQFRGVSHVLTASDMMCGTAVNGFASRIQNGFYPKRSGDLTLNLMPGWSESADDQTVSQTYSGSVYDYDTRVPLAVSGCGIAPAVIYRDIDMRSVASTLARIMGIPNPIGAETEPIEEVVRNF